MNQRNYTASFIASPRVEGVTPEAARRGLVANYLRKEFVVGEGLVSATATFTAIGLIELWLNGERVGDELLVPGWTEYADRVRVSTFDVTHLLAPGANAAGAIVGEGWAVGSMGFTRTHHVWHDRPLDRKSVV
jgi:alpha-L-rhamnosidase